MRIHILEGNRNAGIEHRLEYAFTRRAWFPVVAAARQIKELGATVVFHSTISDALFDCDALLISSRQFDPLNSSTFDPKKRAEEVSKLVGRGPKLIWFDLRDSSGTPQFEVLPYVDLYAKQMLLRDFSLYSKNLYGGRLFSDYMARNLGVNNDYDPSVPLINQQDGFTPLRPEWWSKIALSWDISYDFRCIARAGLARVAQIGEVALGHRTPAIRWVDPGAERPIDVTAIFGLSQYPRRTIVHQRHIAIEMCRSMTNLRTSTNKLPPAKYLKELERSKIVISCFGHGEVCFREHEAWILGASVIMPDMSHLRTYPERYLPNVTFLSTSWDMAELPEAVERLMDMPDLRRDLAFNGQERMRRMYSEDGFEDFAKHFMSIASAINSNPVASPDSTLELTHEGST